MLIFLSTNAQISAPSVPREMVRVRCRVHPNFLLGGPQCIWPNIFN